MDHYDVIVIGGGAIGTSALYHLARRGLSRTLLLERLGGFGRGATGVWGSLVRMFYQNLPTAIAAAQSVPFYRDFEKHVGTPFQWSKTGSLYFMKRDWLPKFTQHLAALEGSGLEYRVLEPAEGRKLFPDYAWYEDDVAIYEPYAGVASPRGTTEAFLREASRLGATSKLEAEVTQIVTNGLVATGVRTADGTEHTCDRLVICAGVWTNAVVESTGVKVHAHPVSIQLNRFCRRQRQLAHPFFIDLPASTFGHPTPTGSFIGGYTGQSENRVHRGVEHVDPAEANLAKHRIAQRLPWIKSATLEGGIKALENYTDSRVGLVEHLGDFQNIVVSTGWSCAGFTLAPTAGARIAEMVASL
jgi:glycine/D-amino acid oxidase-like deaminating enzyme